MCFIDICGGYITTGLRATHLTNWLASCLGAAWPGGLYSGLSQQRVYGLYVVPQGDIHRLQLLLVLKAQVSLLLSSALKKSGTTSDTRRLPRCAIVSALPNPLPYRCESAWGALLTAINRSSQRNHFQVSGPKATESDRPAAPQDGPTSQSRSLLVSPTLAFAAPNQCSR